MIKRTKWIFAAVLTYLLFLLVYFPANQLSSRISLPEGMVLTGVSGTVWQGQAAQMQVQGIPLQGVAWQLSFWPLLLGELDFQVKAGNSRAVDELSFNGNISLALARPQAIKASDFTLFLPTSMVLAQVPLPLPVDAGGRLRVNLDKVDYAQGCQQLQGKGEWLNAQVGGISGPIALGRFEAALSCRQQDILLKISAANSLGLSAEALLSPARQFRVSGRFKPDPSLPDEVHQATRFFGQADNQGFYQFNF